MNISSDARFQLATEAYVEPNPWLYFIFILLVILLISIIAVFIKNIIAKNERVKTNPDRYSLWIDYLKTAAISSILLGVIGTLIDAYDALIRIGISGQFYIDAIAGPIGEALLFLIFGFTNAVVATALVFLCRWKYTKALSN